jgi:hypothetical protein
MATNLTNLFAIGAVLAVLGKKLRRFSETALLLL